MNNKKNPLSTIYFQIHRIVYPKKMTLDLYNKLDHNTKTFIRSTGALFTHDTKKNSWTYATPSYGTICTSVLIPICSPYLVYSSSRYTHKKDERGNSEYIIDEIDTHHVLPPEFYLCSETEPKYNRKYIYDILNSGECASHKILPNIKLQQTGKTWEKMLEISPYHRYLELEKYQDIMVLWHIRLTRTTLVKDLLEQLKTISHDPYEYVSQSEDRCLGMDHIIELFKSERSKNLKWNINNMHNFVNVCMLVECLQKSAIDQRLYEPEDRIKEHLKDCWLHICTQIPETMYFTAKESVDTFLTRSGDENITTYTHIIDANGRIHLRSVYMQLTSVSHSVRKMMGNLSIWKDIPKYQLPVDRKPTVEEEFIWYAFENKKNPIRLLHGAAGTGKTTSLMELVKVLLSNPKTNVLTTAFQGKTQANLQEKVCNPANHGDKKKVPSAETSEEVDITEVDLMKNIDPSDDEENCDDDDDKSIALSYTADMYRTLLMRDPIPHELELFKRNLKVVIVDEIQLMDLRRFSQLLSVVSMTAALLIVVGDQDQIWSIDPGNVMEDIMYTLNDIDPKSITKLTEFRRFDPTSSLCTNTKLMYDKSWSVDRDWVCDKSTQFRYYGHDKNRKDESRSLINMSLESRLLEIYDKHPAKDIQIHTRCNETCHIVATIMSSEENAKKYFPPPQVGGVAMQSEDQLPTFKSDNVYFKPGRRIMITQNKESRTKKNLSLMHLTKDVTYNRRSYTNIEQLYNRHSNQIDSSIKTVDITTCKVSNGTVDVVRKVEFAYEKKEDVIIGFYTIYTLEKLGGKIIVGGDSLFLNPMQVCDGSCITIDKMIGCDSPIAVWIIRAKDHGMDCGRGLVAYTRGKEICYIIFEGDKEKQKTPHQILQRIILRQREMRLTTMKDRLLDALRSNPILPDPHDIKKEPKRKKMTSGSPSKKWKKRKKDEED